MKKYLIILLVVLCSCSFFKKHDKEEVVARAYDKYLYKSDLKDIVPPGTPAKDSLESVKNFINNWLRQQVLLHQAESNLSDEQKDFTEQLENYRNSLIIYKYESELIRQKMDTVVPDEEIKKYYAEHQSDFQLRQNIISVSWAQFPAGYRTNARLKTMMLSSGETNQAKLEEYCQENASNYSIEDQNWITPDDLARFVPLKKVNPDELQKKNSFIEIKDSLSVYIVAIRDFKEKESISPLKFEIKNIKEIILNKRKLELVNRMQDETFAKALKEKEFEKY